MAGLARWTTAIVWLLLVAALAAFAVFAAHWLTTRRLNTMIADRSIEKLAPLPADPRVGYAAAWNLERSQRFDEAIKLFAGVQATADPALAANAWFALGNVYFQSSIKASRESVQEGPRAEDAEFGLARDAYRAALRIDPTLHGARYNLELLERLAPPRSVDGWRRTTDPIKMLPDRHTGWTTIRESKKRGLP
jgi:tetratricopeptide (TPR) repeat protein